MSDVNSKCLVCQHGDDEGLINYILKAYKTYLGSQDDHNYTSADKGHQWAFACISQDIRDWLIKVCPKHKRYFVALVTYLRWYIVFADDIHEDAPLARKRTATCAGCLTYNSVPAPFPLEPNCCLHPGDLCPFYQVCRNIGEDYAKADDPNRLTPKAAIEPYMDAARDIVKKEWQQLHKVTTPEFPYVPEGPRTKKESRQSSGKKLLIEFRCTKQTAQFKRILCDSEEEGKALYEEFRQSPQSQDPENWDNSISDGIGKHSLMKIEFVDADSSE